MKELPGRTKVTISRFLSNTFPSAVIFNSGLLHVPFYDLIG